MTDHPEHAPTTTYRELLEQSGVGVFELHGGEFTYVNEQFADLFGYDPDELVGTSLSSILPTEEHRAFQASIAATDEQDTEHVTTELVGRCEDGSTIELSVQGTITEEQVEETDAKASASGFLGLAEDVTDQHHRERRFEGIFNNTFQFAGLLEVDGTILEANEPALYVGGLDREDVVGKQLWDTYWLESSQAARDVVHDAVEAGRNGQQYREEITVQGEERDPVIDFTIRPIVEDDGTVSRLVAEGHDITDRKARERERQTIIDRVTDAVVEVDEDWRFTLVDDRAEEIYGMTEENLLGEKFWEVFTEGVGTRWDDVYREVMQTREAATMEEFFSQLDGWFHVEIYPDEDGGLAFYFQDITDRKRHEQRIAGLNDVLVRCMEAESNQEISDTVVDACQDQLHLPVVCLATVDDHGRLRPVAQTDGASDRLRTDALLDREAGVGWTAFTAGESATVADPSRYLTGSGPVEDLVVHPLGRHGVLLAGASPADEEFVQTVAESVRRAFDRTEREERLRSRDALLEEQNEALNRLNRINNVIRSIDQVLVSASNRSEIEAAVCEKLTEGDTYTFAWIGGSEPAENALSLRESSGHEQGYVESLPLSGIDGTSAAPGFAAVRRREPVVESDLLTDPPHDAWREKAIRRGFRSAIAIPLTYRDSLYGVLSVYADRPELFEDLERQVLTELGANVGHAINAVESTRALVRDDVVELVLSVDLSDHPLRRFVDEGSSRRFEFEDIVPATDGEYRVYYRVHGASHDAYASFVDRQVAIRDCHLIGDEEESNRYESIITDDSLLFWLLDRGALPRTFTVSQDDTRLRVELSGECDVREFVEFFERTHGDATLLSSRDRDRAARTHQEFTRAVEAELTARQREVLQTAYLSGYFESPRQRTGEELASALGISSPTVSNHLRAGLRKLLDLLYEDEPGARP